MMVAAKAGIHGAHPVKEVRKALERQMVGKQVAERQVAERQLAESDVERDQGGPREGREKPSVQRGQMPGVQP